ncbi:MAG: hypothetical protein COA47_01305 [Robiginitomaculum sp.]|nr:MAG: hypothetical protein COA47_01305 [Robiginitomaculum sp.]
MKKFLTAGVFCLAFTAGLSLPASAAQSTHFAPGPTKLILHSGPDFSGRNRTFQSDEPKLASYNFADIAQSLEVVSGQWEVCVDKRYRGRCEVFSIGHFDLNALGWGSDIASVRRVSHHTDTITLYAKPDFGGQARTFARKMDKLKLYAFHDHAASLRVSGGIWKVCANSNMGGHCELVDRDIPDLGAIGLMYSISSVAPSDSRIGGNDGDVGELVLFEDDSYSGTRISVRNEVADLKRAGFSDRASSLRLQGGKWEVCDRTNFGGRCEIIRHSINNLERINMGDRISSVRPVRYDENSGYRPTPTPDDRWGRDWRGDRQFGQSFQGQRSIFFPEPSVQGYAVSNCIHPGRQCGQQAAQAFCEIAGLDRAVFFDATRGYRSTWSIGSRRMETSDNRSRYLIDVLCSR